MFQKNNYILHWFKQNKYIFTNKEVLYFKNYVNIIDIVEH